MLTDNAHQVTYSSKQGWNMLSCCLNGPCINLAAFFLPAELNFLNLVILTWHNTTQHHHYNRWTENALGGRLQRHWIWWSKAGHDKRTEKVQPWQLSEYHDQRQIQFHDITRTKKEFPSLLFRQNCTHYHTRTVFQTNFTSSSEHPWRNSSYCHFFLQKLTTANLKRHNI